MPEKKFENTFKKLEKVVEKLENENLDLDEALKLYEEGIKYSRFCSARLEDAEKRVQILSRKTNGDFFTEDMKIIKQDIERNEHA